MDNLVLRASLEGHTGWVTSIVTSSENQEMIVSGSRDKTIIVWQLMSDGAFGVPRKALKGHEHFIQDLAISSDGQYVLSASWDKTLVFQVAEALAGTDVIAQAKSFNNALGFKKKIDGFIISKIDTVGNVVGTIVSITWATGIPILFIGNGQTYTDIRVLSVSWVVKMLMS
ncbi:hypothetical protein PCK1_003064 [Pneumocystis canis]|nr:hypothetical protein PCK1_003064 [Pneumocystis canis]